MKLTLGLAAALAGCAAAAATPAAAPVYILSSSSDAASSKKEVPSVSPAEARLILLQRLSPAGAGASTAEIPHSSHVDALVSLLNRYGVAPSPLFTSQDAAATALPSPRQLVVMLEGLSDDQIRDAGARLDAQPAFSIADVPSPRANDRLLADDLDAATPSGACPVSQVTNPFDEGCWNGMATVAKYNVQKTPDVLDDLTRQVGNLAKLARSGEMETTVILLPASASASRWAEPTAHMHRRQASEAHISAYGKTVETSSSSASSKNDEEGSVFYKSSPSASASKSVPACFSSEESCLSGTDSCSGHGTCTNRFPKSKDACFTCHCLSTVNEKSGSLTHWAGKTCAKQDISTPFWLFGGFALLMATILTLSIGMLYSVGEEKMPGVLGAGVSKSSS